jgi:hypothetical protein
LISLKRLSLLAGTLVKLGLPNLARVGLYRLKLRSGLLQKATPKGETYSGPFFSNSEVLGKVEQIDHAAFGYLPMQIPPEHGWHSNLVTGKKISNPNQHWSQIVDFNLDFGDIKTAWEASRFDWLPIEFQKLSERQDRAHAVASAEFALQDWVVNNPANTGPNWKCGQETSLRLVNFLVTLYLAGDLKQPTHSAKQFIQEHVRRVLPTTAYALGQQNNHAVSEGVALFLAGRVLELSGDPSGQKTSQTGKRLLEQVIASLIMKDGTFAQYSVVYHRMVLSLLTVSELMRRELSLPEFSKDAVSRILKAVEWLEVLVDPKTGDAPNLGANDGTHLFNFDGAEYRDFRPVLDAALSVFSGRRAFGRATIADVFGVGKLPLHPLESHARKFEDGGLAVVKKGDWKVAMRVPRFRFRPSQADALHLDIWCGSLNLARDNGSFSYANVQANVWHQSAMAHNTVCFDGRDHMPRLSRFLYGKWLSDGEFELADHQDECAMSASYCDQAGASHHRKVQVSEDHISVSDRLDEFDQSAVLYWHLCEADWKLNDNRLTSDGFEVTIEAPKGSVIQLGKSDRSLYYLHKEALPCLTVTIAKPGIINTVIRQSLV